MIDKILDERYYVADEAIYDAFFLILKEKDVEKITVADVIKRAGVARSTFYNHYENIPALVTAIEDKTLSDIFSLMESFHPENDRDMCKSYFLAICDYAKTNPFLANLLGCPRGNAFLEKAITMLHTYVTTVMHRIETSKSDSSAEQAADNASYTSKEEFSYMIACTIGSTIGVLHKWAREDFSVSTETIADILTKAFTTGMLPFLA